MSLVKKIIKTVFGTNLVYKIEEIVFAGKLDKLAQIYNTDKYGTHMYTPVYSMFFNKLRKKRMNILEIGVGGYDNPNAGGASLKMWKTYFCNSQIYSIDIYDKSNLNSDRITIFQGSQNDPEFLDSVVAKTGNLDIIIDDGSQINEHMIFSFNHLFKSLNKGGYYVVEDSQTSYWTDYGGDNQDLNAPGTVMNFFKSITDSVNIPELSSVQRKDKHIIRNIESIHFYYNQIFILKKH